MGLPRLACALSDDAAQGLGVPRARAKVAAAFSVIDDEDRPLIWTDDDAIPAAGDDRVALEANGRALLIAPRPSRGLQPAHLDEIEEWIRRPRA